METQGLVKAKRKIKSTQLFVVAATILVSLLISLLCVGLTVRYEVDTETADVKSVQYWKLNLPPEQAVWYEKGIEELKSIIIKKQQQGEVESIVIFIAAGVNGDMLARARLNKTENIGIINDFIWDRFPHLGILKSSCSFVGNCDAFTLGTALFGGVKTSKGLGGLDRRVSGLNCKEALNATFYIESIFKQAKDLHMRTGFVTTGRVTGSLLASLYAHSINTQWECDGFMPVKLKAECLDLASQLIKSEEGKSINLIMGGGRQALVSKQLTSSQNISLDESACIPLDQKNLLQDWQSYKMKKNVTFKLLQTSEELQRLKASAWDYVLGIFAHGDLDDKGPNLTTMVMKSLDVMKRQDIGYVFLAETAVKSSKVEHFQQVLWSLDETIRQTFKHPSFTSNNTVLLTIFLDLNRTAIAPNDILVYATGPESHLFHGVHEETYLAHVISYYLKMGIFRPSAATKSKRKLQA